MRRIDFCFRLSHEFFFQTSSRYPRIMQYGRIVRDYAYGIFTLCCVCHPGFDGAHMAIPGPLPCVREASCLQELTKKGSFSLNHSLVREVFKNGLLNVYSPMCRRTLKLFLPYNRPIAFWQKLVFRVIYEGGNRAEVWTRYRGPCLCKSNAKHPNEPPVQATYDCVTTVQ